jgi:putative Ca2+/H+ antiporter (TMEM165/GDT1 family)
VGHLVTALTVFGVIFVGELPDKTAVASLVLGARYSARPVLLGVCGAFLVHVTIAVTAGGLIAQLPHRPVELASAAFFLFGAVFLLRSNTDGALEEGEEEAATVTGVKSPRQVVAASFGVVFVAEFGDLTQLLTASLAARYDDAISVGIGALLALWTVAALAVTFGRTLLRVVPQRRVQQVAALALLALSIYSIVEAA